MKLKNPTAKPPDFILIGFWKFILGGILIKNYEYWIYENYQQIESLPNYSLFLRSGLQ